MRGYIEMVENRLSRQEHHIAVKDMLPGKFDYHDLALISALAEDTRLTAVELSERVHLSRPAISRRLAALADCGYLRSSSTIKNYEDFGFGVRARIELSTGNQVGASITEWLLQRPEVLAVSIITGDSLMTLDAIAVDMHHLHVFVRELQKFGETSTQVIFSTVYSEISLVERVRRARAQLREEARKSVKPVQE